ncbi:hypothetical protein P7F60_29395 [Rhizobium sp. YJ-22]|uniref:hypothetical protein n=1 Tax=Rhizobium sp. YJ-22 TaxID=3037556 RepID=UPI00241265E0|nr:hypothetical protein [Rhizobium sp. YJ-22]MDG3580497.1 hypothetical protein [Rhizobium sp. YJ-22]
MISTDWFGMSRPEAFNSAKAARASMQAFRTALVSISCAGGSAGRSLKARSGRNVMRKQPFPADLGAGYVDGDDMSPECVDEIEIYRHIVPVGKTFVQMQRTRITDRL